MKNNGGGGEEDEEVEAEFDPRSGVSVRGNEFEFEFAFAFALPPPPAGTIRLFAMVVLSADELALLLLLGRMIERMMKRNVNMRGKQRRREA